MVVMMVMMVMMMMMMMIDLLLTSCVERVVFVAWGRYALVSRG